MTLPTSRSFPILLYHSLTAEARPTYRPYAVDPSRFRNQMGLLAAEGYHTLTVRELAAILVDPTREVPERTALVTFDDGFEEVHSVALPILAALGLRATVFVVSAAVGGTSSWLSGARDSERRLLDWTEIRELHAAGIEIGSHGHTHRQLDVLSPTQIEEEVRRSKEVLEEGIGSAISSFAYPHGYHSAIVKELVRQSGYRVACGVKHALSHPSDDRWALGRAVVTADTTDGELRRWLDGHGLARSWTVERPQTVAWRIVRRARSKIARGTSRAGSPAA